MNKINEMKAIMRYLQNITMDSELEIQMKRNAFMALNDLLNIDAGVRGQYPVHKYDWQTNTITSTIEVLK